MVRRLLIVAAAVAGLFLLSGCSQATTDQWKRLGLPEGASDRAPYIQNLWIGAWIAALIVGFLVWGLILWAVVRYRRRSDEEVPVQVRYHLPLEMLYTAAPILMVAVLFFFTVKAQNNVLEDVQHPDHDVLVTGQQWSWTFSYLHEPAVGGVDVFDVGTPERFPTLWLVEDETVRFTLHSPDVIHSFWVPAFLFKMDVFPGHDQGFSITPDRKGTFAGRCAELCGYQHSAMLFTVKVVSQAQYDAHIRALKAAGQIGALRGGGDSERVAGLETSHAGEASR